jgi:hypothetical protein
MKQSYDPPTVGHWNEKHLRRPTPDRRNERRYGSLGVGAENSSGAAPTSGNTVRMRQSKAGIRRLGKTNSTSNRSRRGDEKLSGRTEKSRTGVGVRAANQTKNAPWREAKAAGAGDRIEAELGASLPR